MVFEQMLTILLGTGAGVAVVLYAVKPRQISASTSFVSGGTSIETFSLSSSTTTDSQNDAAPSLEVTTAAQSPVVEAPVEEFNAVSSVPVSAATAVSAAPQSVAVSSSAAPAVRAHRVSRRSSAASPRARQRSRVGSPSGTASKATRSARRTGPR